MQRHSSSLIGVAVALLTPVLLHAQRLEVGPALGGLLPLGSYQAPTYFRTDLPNTPGDLTGYTIGAHARLRFGRLGLQLEASEAKATVGGGASPSGTLPPAHPRVQLASLQATYYLTPRARRTQGWLTLGPAVVRHIDAGYSALGSPTHFAGIVGSGVSIPFVGPLRAELTASLAMYHLSVRDAQGANLERGLQLDSRVALGLSWLLH